MYRIEEKIEAIKEVQRLLNLNQTGLFDKKTRDAVLNVQSKYKLAETGIVDYLTFTSIVEEYSNEKNNQWRDSGNRYFTSFNNQKHCV